VAVGYHILSGDGMAESMNSSSGPIPILYVNYFGTIGGGQVQLLTLLDGLDKKRFLPYVVCCEEGGFWDELVKRGINPIKISFGKGKRRYLRVSIPAYFKFYQVLKQLGVRLVQVQGLQEAKLAAYPCSYAKVPMLWVVAP
jgi:hypothetical protein